jgi:hypothetical protein
VTAANLYDDQHRYIGDHRRDDPAWPGRTPEPYEEALVADVLVPVAHSWAARAIRVHHDLVVEMLRALPGRNLTRIAGHGDKSESWMALNDGPDGHGSWLIAYDPDKAGRQLAAARRDRRSVRLATARTLRAFADRLDPNGTGRGCRW